MKYLLILIVLIGFLGNVSGQSRADKKKAKKEMKEKSFAGVKEFFEKGDFKFVAEWADTQKGRRINLITNSNSFIKKDTKVNAHLPYYGVVQVGSMNGEGGIGIVEASPEKEKIKYNEKKYTITYSFSVKSSRGGESLNCILIIQNNFSATLSVRSSQRNLISYTGTVSLLE